MMTCYNRATEIHRWQHSWEIMHLNFVLGEFAKVGMLAFIELAESLTNWTWKEEDYRPGDARERGQILREKLHDG